jgi:hypothetical protein
LKLAGNLAQVVRERGLLALLLHESGKPLEELIGGREITVNRFASHGGEPVTYKGGFNRDKGGSGK